MKLKTSTANLLRALLRRLLIGAVMLPPIVGVTAIEEEKPRARHMRAFENQIVIPGSRSYLDPNPSF